MWWTVIIVVIVAGSIFAVFSESFSGSNFTWGDLWRITKKIVLFIPYLIIGIILHIAGDFKNHRMGYIVLFAVIAFIGFGFYMGYKAGPESTPWE